MNEKDKKAFWDWLHDQHHAVTLETVWQAACEYKQGEIDELVFLLCITEDLLAGYLETFEKSKLAVSMNYGKKVLENIRAALSKHEANQ